MAAKDCFGFMPYKGAKLGHASARTASDYGTSHRALWLRLEQRRNKSLEKSASEDVLREVSGFIAPYMLKCEYRWQRRILVRWEYHSQSFLGFVQLACLIILFRRF